MRGPEFLLVVPDIRKWYGPHDDPLEREIRYVDQVRSALKITNKLCRPPIATEQAGPKKGWIPVRRFPVWTRCLKCGLLHRQPWSDRERNGTHCWNSGTSGKGTASNGCGGRLEQVPWVLVHEEGYLADAPWHELAHYSARARRRAAEECLPDWHEPYLLLRDQPSGRPLVRCRRCKSSGPLGYRYHFSPGTWQQPWLPEPPRDTPDEPGWLVEINDVRVHSPLTRTALVIPPESRIRRGTVVDLLYSSTRQRQRIERARNDLARNSAIRSIAGEYGCSWQEVSNAVNKIDRGYPLYGRPVSEDDLNRGEYKALTGIIPDLRDDEDFVNKHHTPAWKALRDSYPDGTVRRTIDAVDRLVAVERLKEIMVFQGFRRARSDDSRNQVPPDIVGQSDWLPAVELYGEGVFFTLDEAVLARWEANPSLHQRADAFARRYGRSGVQDRPPDILVTPRLLLCHTLAHLLIRQLETLAGYPAASLKERLYCAAGAAANVELPGEPLVKNSPMAGILIYVAVADEEGSLGGLAELAEPERFLRLLAGALEASYWCSLDPVCGEREGHGPYLLNGAACHACALVPETSCEHGNILLDRTFVKGDGAELPAFLDCVDGTV